MTIIRWICCVILVGFVGAASSQVYVPATNLLPAGSRIVPGGMITSPNGLARLVMQYDGNLVLYDGNWYPIWYSGTHGRPGAWATIQSDGNLVVYDPNGYPLYNIFDFSRNPHAIRVLPTGGWPAFLSVQDDGNMLVLMGEARWNGSTWPQGSQSPATILKAGQTIPSGGFIRSPNGRFQLSMQVDGNLILYDIWAGWTVRWASWTHGNPGAWAYMQMDGNFVVYSANSIPLWWSLTGPRQDGNLQHLNVHDDGSLYVMTYWRNFALNLPAPSSGIFSNIKWGISCKVDAYFTNWQCW